MKISSNRILTFGIIPLLLLLLWFVLSLFYASKYSFSVIPLAYNKSNFISLKTDELLAKQKVSAQFQAKENNLGIVSVRFKTYSRINNDIVIFRLKETGKNDWYYQYQYKVDQFQDNDYFTFGFPIILNSINKTYYFEIESTKGKIGDAVSISTKSPIFIAQHQFTKQQLLANKTMIPEFLIKKIYYSFSDINFLISSFVYLLPFIYYILWFYLMRPLINIGFPFLSRFSIKNWNVPIEYRSGKKYLLLYIHLVAIFILIFFMNTMNNYVNLIMIGLWIILIMIYRFGYSISYLLALFFLLLCPVLFIFNQESIAENAAMWTYFFLVMGTAGAIVELKGDLQNMVDYKMMLKGHFSWRLKEKNK